MQAVSSDPRALRRFGMTLASLLVVVFAVVPPLVFNKPARLWPWFVAAPLALFALVAPARLAALQRGWFRLGNALGAVNSRIILVAMYAVLVVPIALVLKLLRRDAMARAFRPDLASYRTVNPRAGASSMERPY